MLTIEQNERFTQVGAGTPMGELFRRYWYPIAAASQLKDLSTKKVRLLGEDLILYKDRSGTLGLIEPHCAHRRMNLIYGIPEEHGLRCPYHGWLYDETGQCTEQPYEETEDPDARFKDKIKMKAYPVEQKAGLIFAYLGPAPAPLVPNWDVFAADDVIRDIGYAELPCSWLQCQENSLDPVHLEWLHVGWANYIAEMRGESDNVRPHRHHAKIGFDRFEYGIYKRRVMEGGSEEDTSWREGHPIVFPYFLRQGGSGIHRDHWSTVGPSFQIRVPLDDTHTGHWWVMCHPKLDTDPEQRPEDVPFFQPPVVELDEDGQPRWSILDTNSAQDVAAWITQGPIADRTGENLGRSDKGIIMFRQMLEENIRIVEDGGDPMNTFRDPEKNVYHGMDTELPRELAAARNKGDQGGTGTRLTTGNAGFQRQGMASKFSPILTARGLEGGVDAAERRKEIEHKA
ncbi:MAG: aromatic ring-hydroxylating dioxygenase subunit alpha [Chloroflexi bacterium]|nr:aromatic ring-hydroxylating dioxygenase subunit alpha [Chloroflexota bacterium]